MLNALAYLLMAIGLIEKQHAEGLKTDWPRALAVMAWITLFTLAAIGLLIWGLEQQSVGWGMAGFLVVAAAGYTLLALGVRRWPAVHK
jgi:hypothetical protein